MIFIEKFTNNGDINVVPFKEVVQFCQSLKKQVHSFVEIFVSEEDDLLGVNLQKPAFFYSIDVSIHKCTRVIDHAAKFVVTVKIRSQLLLRALRKVKLQAKVQKDFPVNCTNSEGLESVILD